MAKGITRREFLDRSKALIAGAAGSYYLAGCQQVPTIQETHAAVVIGSGFGGSVAALRLGQAGVETVVLERGRRWPITPTFDTFPRMMDPDKRSSWLSYTTQFPGLKFRVFSKYAGLVEQVKGIGMDVVVGAAVGGSSVVYGAMMLHPTPALFQQVFPPQVSYAEMADVYFPMVKQTMGLGKISDALLALPKYKSSRLFLEHAQQTGLNGQKIYSAVDWNVVQQELNGTIPASATIGESVLGMNNGAKNSLDRNYLKLAEATGSVAIYPLHIVREIKDLPGGGYLVVSDRIDVEGNVTARLEITCTYLFLAAGSVGTSKLLVRAKAKGMLPNLNGEVGKHWGNNGDHLFLRILSEKTGAPQAGPPCTAIFHHDNPIAPVTFEHGPAPFEFETYGQPMLGMGIPQKSGKFYYDSISDTVRLTWPWDGDQKAVSAMWASHAKLNAGTSGLFALDMNAFHKYTYHPLGGAVLGKACDYYGRVLGYSKMYVVDAALIAGSTACCNPAWTVGALAERCMAKILAQDF